MPDLVVVVISCTVGLLVGVFLFKCLNMALKCVDRIAKSLDNIADAIKQRPTTEAQTQYFSRQKSPKEIESKVAELPPEVIAPTFTKPPRPRGGFGTRTGQRDNGDS